MRVTLREVAQRSHVSISTASRVLNGRGDVRKEVQERVLTAARELQYTVNQHARALREGTSKTLGVVLYDARATSFNGPLLRGIYDAATPRGYSVMVCDAGASAEAERQAYQQLLERRVDGVLINSGVGGVEPLRRLATAGMPFVVLNRRIDDADGVEADYVLVEAEHGSYLATRHLLELGHERILYHTLAGQSVPALERSPGYRRALAEYGIPFAPDCILETPASLAETHARVMDAMGRLRPRPTAVVAFNDLHATAVLKALADLKLRVPHDVAVVGQNNLEFTPYLVPPLTTVVHTVQQLGRQGVELLLQRLTWPDDEPWLPHRVALEPTLIVRESSGGPRSNVARGSRRGRAARGVSASA
ncbi:MAG: LacI family DNA-binding transcriptional regulator [Chloroflexi bacterium]|nr:LacI family DNA-binding transcriptional regulator [Chloroflexota bacterium]